jgi:hypothetical protein
MTSYTEQQQHPPTNQTPSHAQPSLALHWQFKGALSQTSEHRIRSLARMQSTLYSYQRISAYF